MPEYEIDIVSYAAYRATVTIEATDETEAATILESMVNKGEVDWDFNDAEDFEIDEIRENN